MNKTRLNLVKILTARKGEYISGEYLSRKLGVSRTAIWKHIKKLQVKGYKINSCQNRGYCLFDESKKPIPEVILTGLDTSFIGQEIKYFPKIDSTNKKAREFAINENSSGMLVIADEQLEGRGRLGRKWYSPPGTGLWFSLILRPDLVPGKAPLLTVIACLAVTEALEKRGLKPIIKWPNDIIVAGKKVAGILAEIESDMDKINFTIIGIGINVNQDSFPHLLKDIATSLKLTLEGKMELDRIRLLQDLLLFFEELYNRLLAGEEERIMKTWKQKIRLLGEEVNVQSNGKSIRGMAVDISPRGELMIKTDKGLKKFWAGDVNPVENSHS